MTFRPASSTGAGIAALLGGLVASAALGQPNCPPQQQTVTVGNQLPLSIPVQGGPHDVQVSFLSGASFVHVEPLSALGTELFTFTITGVSPGTSKMQVLFTQSPFSATCSLDVTVNAAPPPPPPPPPQTPPLAYLTTHSGPLVWEHQFADWIDRYFEDGNKRDGVVNSTVISILTQCYGGSWLDSLDGTAAGGYDAVRFTHSTAVSAQDPGLTSNYTGYHDDAANALAPGATVDDVHVAGILGKVPRERPFHVGNLEVPIVGGTSTHLLLWASAPEPLDWVDIGRIMNNFSGFEQFQNGKATMKVLAGDGTHPYANGAATAANLEAALREIGGLMDDGADEHFVFFVTDHGSYFNPGNVPPPSGSSRTESASDAATLAIAVELSSEVLADMLATPANRPTVEIQTLSPVAAPSDVEVSLNGHSLGTLAAAEAHDVPGAATGGTWRSYSFELDEPLLVEDTTQHLELTSSGEGPELALAGIGSGAIPRPADILRPLATPVCEAGPNALCLLGGRFQVLAANRDFASQQHLGRAQPWVDRAGYFTFFSTDNPEVFVKVVDATAVDESFWIFHGSLTTTAYSLLVSDLLTGRTLLIRNPPGQQRGGVRIFAASGGDDAVGAATYAAWAGGAGRLPAVQNGAVLPLLDDRFEIEVRFSYAGIETIAPAIPLGDDAGGFWFFSDDNPEVTIKILDGRAITGTFWVFAASLSHLEFTLTVRDTATGKLATFHNPPGSFLGVSDLSNFED